jgi:hypothetical protein
MKMHSVIRTLSLLALLGYKLFALDGVAANTDIPNDYIHIECDIAPLTRSVPHATHPNIPPEGMRAATGYSTNWSGYVAATNLSRPLKNSVTAASGSWVVPTIQRSTKNSYCAIWVGIDGYSNTTVEQIGTSHDWINGRAYHYAWFEMYPGPSYMINGFPLKVGDVITATVDYTSKNVFTMRLYNNTRKVVTTIPTRYTTSTTALRQSAEWIVEAPYLNGILPLANFKTIYLTNCRATINGISGFINNSRWANSAITMITSTGTIKDVPSGIGSNGSFFVTWKHQ